TSDHTRPVINIKQEYKFFKVNEVDAFLGKLHIYFSYYAKFSSDDYTWKNRKSFAGYGISDLQKMREIIEEIPASQADFTKKTEELLGFKMDLTDGEKVFEMKDKLYQVAELLENEKVYEYFAYISHHQELSPDLLWLSNAEKNLMACFKDNGPEISLTK